MSADAATALARGTVTIDTEAELKKKLASGRSLRIKLGVDPTLSDLTVGHAVPLRKLRQFQDLGHTAVLIIGDYTACVGDPSGRNKTRPQPTHEEVLGYAETYVEQARKILDPDKMEVAYNGSWFADMNFLDVIRLASRTTVARLLERDDFSKRYKSEMPIAVHEFLYPLMQAYDSVQVKADVELGATDQTFNLLLGRDLMRQEGLEPQVCMTVPILVGLDGEKKMSKSLGNYIGLNDPPEEMYGKAMSIPDRCMEDYFILCTSVPADEVATRIAGDPRETKGFLASELVRLYHGEDAAKGAEEHFNRVFRDRKEPESIEEVTIDPASLEDGAIWIVKLLVESGLAAKNNEARRKIEGGGVTYADEKITDPKANITVVDGAVLKAGKRHFRRTRLG